MSVVEFSADDLAMLSSACKSLRKLGVDGYEKWEDTFDGLTPGLYVLVPVVPAATPKETP